MAFAWLDDEQGEDALGDINRRHPVLMDSCENRSVDALTQAPARWLRPDAHNRRVVNWSAISFCPALLLIAVLCASWASSAGCR
jgi:hypothetical protein